MTAYDRNCQKRLDLIADIELLAGTDDPPNIARRLGYDNPRSLARRLMRAGRNDLARMFEIRRIA